MEVIQESIQEEVNGNMSENIEPVVQSVRPPQQNRNPQNTSVSNFVLMQRPSSGSGRNSPRVMPVNDVNTGSDLNIVSSNNSVRRWVISSNDTNGLNSRDSLRR